jgi:hypothetical protein
VRFVNPGDLPEWVRQGLADALKRKLAEETPTAH